MKVDLLVEGGKGIAVWSGGAILVRSVDSGERGEGEFTYSSGLLSILPSSESSFVAMTFRIRHPDMSLGIERGVSRAVPLTYPGASDRCTPKAHSHVTTPWHTEDKPVYSSPPWSQLQL